MIELRNVTKVFSGGTRAVDRVSLTIDEGKLCILLGPSGCGKTTTLKMINRLIPMTSGEIAVGGEDIRRLRVNQLRRRIGYAIQEIGLFPHMTVAQNVATVPRLLGWPKARRRKRAAELLDLLGLTPPEDYLDRFPAELSGGQRQRVGVARALGADPSILLMDEPFGAIDPITRERLQDEFLRIQREIRKTIAFVTHDIHEAIKLGDEIALMRSGKVVQYGTPTQLLSQPADDFVREFVGADRTLKALRLVRVRDVMDANPDCVSLDDGAAETLARMDTQGLAFVPVVDSEGRLEGWVGASDLRAVGAGTVRSALKRFVVLGHPGMPLNEALALMFESAVGNLAVTDEERKLVGLVTFDRMFSFLQRSYAEREAEGVAK